ncbi:hypothetical protein C8R43DRAFT_563557 [Mycena crocata]|nr:hypothetical protein C8R43DRAFT_563557 [Mycena crocata]
MTHAPLELVIDDQCFTHACRAGGFFTFSPAWRLFRETGHHEDALMTLKDIPDNDNSTVTLTFSGVAITVFGTFEYKRPGAVYNVSLDGGAPSQYFLDQDNIEVTADRSAFYAAANLSDSTHTLFFTNFQNNQGFGFDYALITPGTNASWASIPQEDNIQTASVYVNVSDPMISYAGGWKRELGGFSTSSTEGDVMNFSFSGSHIAVSGLWQSNLSGNLSLGFSLDGGPLDVISYNFDETSDTILSFYNASYPSGGNHNISVEVSEISGRQAFVFGGFFYSPDFTSLATMPDLPLPSSPMTLSVPYAHRHPKSHVAIIAGTTTAMVVLLAIAVLALILCKRRQRRKTKGVFAASVLVPYEKDYAPTIPSSSWTVTEAIRGSSTWASQSSDEPPNEQVNRLVRMIEGLQGQVHALQQPPAYSGS